MENKKVRKALAAYHNDPVAREAFVACQKDAAEARLQAKAKLRVHLGKLINVADKSDFEFLCRNGVKVKACRMLLQGRSSKLDAMVEGVMLGTDSSVLNLPEISSAGLLPVLEYLYTGRIIDYPLHDWNTGLEVMTTAHHFNLAAVVEISRRFLEAKIAHVGDDLQQAAIMLSGAVNYKLLPSEERNITLQLVGLVRRDWMNVSCLCYLSEEALSYLLLQTMPNLEAQNSTKFSLDEYFRLRAVLLWCVCKGHCTPAEKAQEVVNRVLPIAKEELYCERGPNSSDGVIAWLPRCSVNDSDDEIFHFLLPHPIDKQIATRLLAHIVWVRIPPPLFVRLVEPLQLVPNLQLLDIYRFHSLHRFAKLKWFHGTSYTIHNEGYVIQCANISPGFAVCQLVNHPGDDFSVWRFTYEDIDKVPYSELGFIFGEDITSGLSADRKGWLSYHCSRRSLSRLPKKDKIKSRALCWRAGLKVMSLRNSDRGEWFDYPFENEHTLPTVEFKFSRVDFSCSITVDSYKYGPVWTNLPRGIIFPAVTLGGEGRIRLEVVSGFEAF